MIILSVLLATAGTAILVGYVRGAEQRALKGESTVEVLVATTAIPKGTKAEAVAAMVKTEQVPAKVAASGAVASTGSIAGRVAAVEILPGEQLVQSRFAAAAGLAWLVSTKFLIVVTGYFFITLSYSLRFKRYLLIDILIL